VPCRNICTKIGSNFGYYSVGIKYCSRCEVYLFHEGKKAYLSPRHIKEKIPEIIRFVLYYTTSIPYYNSFVNKILDICESDPELNSELKKIELEQMRKLVPELLHIWHSGLLEYQEDTKGTFNKYKSRDDCQESNPLKYYAYIEFRYKDGDLYEKQKSEWKQKKRKAKPDGWRTCHIVKVTDLDPDFLMKIQNRDAKISASSMNCF
jgi:hypothetical protein